MTKISMTHSIKFCLGWAICFGFRLIPGSIRPPNVEPILATSMPFAKRLSAHMGFVFAFLSIALFDLATGKYGMWTWITAIAYGVIAAGAGVFLAKRKGRSGYVIYAIIGTLFYDIVTGLSVGPLFYEQPFMEALVGQIPFTINHLVSNILFAAIASPLIEQWIVANPKLEWSKLTKATS